MSKGVESVSVTAFPAAAAMAELSEVQLAMVMPHELLHDASDGKEPFPCGSFMHPVNVWLASHLYDGRSHITLSWQAANVGNAPAPPVASTHCFDFAVTWQSYEIFGGHFIQFGTFGWGGTRHVWPPWQKQFPPHEQADWELGQALSLAWGQEEQKQLQAICRWAEAQQPQPQSVHPPLLGYG
jgi:hypothetical protein